MYGADLERLKKEAGLTPEVLPAELGGTLPHGDELAKVSAVEVYDKNKQRT